LGVDGEDTFRGRGISYCATCDGAYFEGKDIHVIGGGSSAVEESLFLTQFARTVTIVHRKDAFRADPLACQEAAENPKIKVLWNHVPRAFFGTEALNRLRLENLKTHEVFDLPTDGIFIFIGMVPRTELLKGIVPLNEWGEVTTDESMRTGIPGLFAAGDIRAKPFRQITTAVADGTIAALAVQKYFRESST
jgi:thioredoxin reductase (NADPH)